MPHSVNVRRLVRRRGGTRQRRLQCVMTALARCCEQVQILPEPLASEKLMPVVRGSHDDAINVLASRSRIEERAKRTSSVGPTRVCVTAGEYGIFLKRATFPGWENNAKQENDERSDSPSRKG